ncbi:MAG: DNA pilot protein [Microvirus sp.]|nr:MAG: DNA pilot protein [Microvirus sp.]
MGGFNPLDLIAGGVTAAGDYFTGQANAKQARENYQHRYQWQVADMKKAGLNPALAYGAPAPVPNTQPTEPLGTSFSRGTSAGAQARATAQDADLKETQKNLLKAQTLDLIQQVKLKNELFSAQAASEKMRPQLIGEQANLTHMQSLTEAEKPKLLRQAYQQALMNYQWQSATWDTRVQIFTNQAKKSGLDVTEAEIRNFLMNAKKPQATAESNFWQTTGAMNPALNSAASAMKILMMLLK